MTPQQLRAAQKALGLSDEDFARMLGFANKAQMRRLKVEDATKPSHRPVRAWHKRLIDAYLAGYRPADWPAPSPRTGQGRAAGAHRKAPTG